MSQQTDPWASQRTHHDLPADEVISALQKEIRRGHTENAALIAYELLLTSEQAEDYLWLRLQVISVEDVGLAQPNAPVLVRTLEQIRRSFARDHGDRFLFAIHAVRFLCGCQKDRSSDELLTWMRLAADQGAARPSIPDYALDMHTTAGKARGRGLRHFLEEGAQVAPELPGRDTTYRERILALLVDS